MYRNNRLFWIIYLLAAVLAFGAVVFLKARGIT